MHIKDDVCDSDSELCCSKFLREIIALLQDTMCSLPELCGLHSLYTADGALIVR